MIRKLLFLFILTCQYLMAQNFEIFGILKDSGGEPLASSAVQLVNFKDSVLVKADIADIDGKFTVLAPSGKYYLFVSLVGYKKTYFGPYDLTQKIDAGELKIATEVIESEGVTIVAKKPLIEVQAGKIVMNVENSINAAGSTAMDLIRKSPGVLVDNNDNISLKGKSGVKIYIDGKMVQIDGANLAAYLKSLNSNDIEAIEMISSPGAKFDAAGNAGIINIRLKKNKNFGTNGNVSAGFTQGYTPKGNVGLSLNYRNQKVAVFSNVSAAQGIYRNGMYFDRIQRDTLYDQVSESRRDAQSLGFKVGTDYFINPKHTIGVLLSGNYNHDKGSGESTTIIKNNQTGEFLRNLISNNKFPTERTNINSNVNYRFADTSGFEITADLDYGIFRGNGNSYQPNNYFDNNNNLIYSVVNRNQTPTDIDIYTAKVDFSQKFLKGKLGYGAKTAYVKTNNTFNFFNEINTEVIKDLSKSNGFEYTENVNAAYANYDREINDKFSFSAGLRLEQTNSFGDLTRADGIVQSDNQVKRHYINLFPSGTFNWNINKKHTLGLAYTKRIDRPSYQDLNPFENKLTELDYEKGNAFLKPQYTNNIRLSHTFMGFVTTTLDYTHVSDFVTMITDTTNNRATYIQQRNLDNQQLFGFEIGSPLPLAKWWNGYANFNLSYQKYKGEFNGSILDTKVTSYGAYLQNTITLPKEFSFEFGGWFSGPSVWGGTWLTKSQWALDLGVSKNLFKKMLNLKVSASDIFFTAPWRATSNYSGANINGGGYWESRTVRINATWRFGNSKVKINQRKGGSESEKNRIK